MTADPGLIFAPNNQENIPGEVWHPTMQLRRRRPGGATDADIVLEQLFVSYQGKQEWREIELVLED